MNNERTASSPMFETRLLFFLLSIFFLCPQTTQCGQFGDYVKDDLSSSEWSESSVDKPIPLVDLKADELREALSQIRHRSYPLTVPAIQKKDIDIVQLYLFQHNCSGPKSYLLVAQMQSNVPPKTLRKRFFRRMSYLFRNKLDETAKAYKEQRIYNRTVPPKDRLALTREYAAFRITTHENANSGKKCRNGWFFYSNPVANHPFKARNGQFTLFWYFTSHETAFIDFLKHWSSLRNSIDFEDSLHDPFEKGQLLPLTSLAAGREHGDWTTLKAASSGYACGAAATYALKVAVGAERPNGHGYVSFPSGHTNSAATAAGSIGYLHRKTRLPLIALSILTGRSRVRSQHHTVLDTLVGGVLGYYIGRHLGKRMKELDRDTTQAKTINLHTFRF